MKVNFVKQPGGTLVPASDAESEKMTRFKTGELYEVDMKLSRNPEFHRKAFKFLNFCFEFWKGTNEFQNEAKQFDVFRNHLTVLAGFYDSYYGIDGRVRVEAHSLSFASMDQEEFEKFYHAAISVAMKEVFKTVDENTLNKLMSFF